MEQTLATPARRILARVVEGFLTFAVGGLVLTALGVERFDEDQPRAIPAAAGLLMVGLEVVLLRAYGGTLGHLLFGMRAVNDDGTPLMWNQAFTRTAVFVLLPLVIIRLLGIEHGLFALVDLGWTVALLVSMITDPRHRGLHDRAAGTTVVRV